MSFHFSKAVLKAAEGEKAWSQPPDVKAPECSWGCHQRLYWQGSAASSWTLGLNHEMFIFFLPTGLWSLSSGSFFGIVYKLFTCPVGRNSKSLICLFTSSVALISSNRNREAEKCGLLNVSFIQSTFIKHLLHVKRCSLRLGMKLWTAVKPCGRMCRKRKTSSLSRSTIILWFLWGPHSENFTDALIS